MAEMKTLTLNGKTYEIVDEVARQLAETLAYTHPKPGAKTGVPSQNLTLSHGGTFVVTQPVCDEEGHITALNTRTYTLPPDNNTIYSAGTGISISGTTIINSGVRAISTGGTNGTITVNTNGSVVNVAVKGLGSAAYTNSNAYAAASHSHSYLPLSGGTLTGNLLGKNVFMEGSIYTGGKTSTADGVYGVAFGSAGNVALQGESNPRINFFIGKSTTAEFGVGAIDGAYVPTKNGSINLGSGSYRWKQLYAATSTIATSDEREKSDIMAIADYPVTYSRGGSGNVFDKLFYKLQPKTFTLNVEDTADLHIGLVAQDVEMALEELGLSVNDLGLIVHDEWIDAKTGEKKDLYGLRYEELIALNIRETQIHQEEIAELKSRIAQLEESLA